MLALLLACGALTLSKAFALFVVVLLAYRVTGLPSPRRLMLLAALGAGIALATQAAGFDQGKFEHVAGLATALRHVGQGQWLGEGIGNAGNYAGEGADEREVGAESGLGNLLAQAGVVALAYIAWLQRAARDVLQRARCHADPAGPWVAAMLLGWFVSFLFSASSLGIGGNALIFMSVALFLRRAAPAGAGAARSASG